MNQDAIASLICIYGLGAIITIMSMDDFVAFNRRVFLWPFYWAYLIVFAGICLWKEVRK